MKIFLTYQIQKKNPLISIKIIYFLFNFNENLN